MSKKLLVTVDSLRYDRMNSMPVTKNYMDEWHDKAFATFPATLGSFPAIMGGEYAVTPGLPEGSSVTHQMQGHKVGITTNHLLSPRYLYDQGFDEFQSPSGGGEGLREKMSAKLEMGGMAYKTAVVAFNTFQRLRYVRSSPDRTFRPGDDVVDSFLGEVDDQGDWFGWLHFMEPHHPYEPATGPLSRVELQNLTRRALSGWTSEKENEILRAAYDRECAELDKMLVRLWEEIPEDTQVIFCADHGEFLGDFKGIWGHPGELHPHLLHVPFGTKNIDQDLGDLVSLIDIPTILRGEKHNDGNLNREFAFAAYGDKRAVTNGNEIATNYNEAYDVELAREKGVSRGLQRQLDNFHLDGDMTRNDALKEDLDALGYA